MLGLCSLLAMLFFPTFVCKDRLSSTPSVFGSARSLYCSIFLYNLLSPLIATAPSPLIYLILSFISADLCYLADGSLPPPVYVRPHCNPLFILTGGKKLDSRRHIQQEKRLKDMDLAIKLRQVSAYSLLSHSTV